MLGLPGDMRDYGIGAQVLVDLGLKKIRMKTNNPGKLAGLQGYDLEIAERVPIVCKPNEDIAYYLDSKRKKMGHVLDEQMFDACIRESDNPDTAHSE